MTHGESAPTIKLPDVLGELIDIVPAQIVVLTPVRNEDWILEAFLRITSQFADHIIVADQGSTDGSREICKRFSKVHLVENPSGTYDEASRQRLLLDCARRLISGPRLLLALDADELATSDSVTSAVWGELRQLPLATALFFQKYEMLPHPVRVEREGGWYALGYLDDGRAHEGQAVHSVRVPVRESDRRVLVPEIRFFHLACLRQHEYCARQAYYCMVENLQGTKSWAKRSIYYSESAFRRRFKRPCMAVPADWIETYASLGVSLESVRSERFNLFHRRCLEIFEQNQAERFWWDDIWWEDWKQASRTLAGGSGVSKAPDFPPAAVGILRWLAVRMIIAAAAASNWVRKLGRVGGGGPHEKIPI